MCTTCRCSGTAEATIEPGHSHDHEHHDHGHHHHDHNHARHHDHGAIVTLEQQILAKEQPAR
jgi:hydrogenase nickel incorporation protein HypB